MFRLEVNEVIEVCCYLSVNVRGCTLNDEGEKSPEMSGKGTNGNARGRNYNPNEEEFFVVALAIWR